MGGFTEKEVGILTALIDTERADTIEIHEEVAVDYFETLVDLRDKILK